MTEPAVDLMQRGEFTLSAEQAKRLAMHTYCLWFPALDATDYENLGDSIQSQGLVEPIVLLNGEVFDGRHRLKACLERDVTPRFLNFEDFPSRIEPIEWVLAKNQYRRHLNPEQWVASVAKAEAERERLEG